MSIYVEILIRADIEQLWRHTQAPDLHARWDLRFTDIRYLPRPDPAAPQRFLYETRIGFGLRIQGEGETLATHEDASGTRTSSLRFWSNDPKSLIRVGSGYWQYVPLANGVRFLTRYQYETRFGRVGQLFNAAVFEPLLGWATAWSFDRLRLWLEDGVEPSAALSHSVIHALARTALGVIWIYQGLVPKLLFTDSGELEIMRRAHVLPVGVEPIALRLLGVAEIGAGLALLRLWRTRALFIVNVLALGVLTAGAARTPRLFRAPFNPAALNLSMAALACIGFLAGRGLPSASSCLRRPRTK